MAPSSQTRYTYDTYDPNMDYRSSVAASDTTYHSFNDIELFEPASPPRPTTAATSTMRNDGTYQTRRESFDQRPSTAVKMQRQDSGYESYTTSPRTSTSHSRPMPLRRMSNKSSSSNNMTNGSQSRQSRSRTRPSTRRSTTSYHNPTTKQIIYQVQANPAPKSTSYFQFPAPDLVELTEAPTHQETRGATPPPATTHYWTSDSTRRLEYAAIDAASRGVKGWFRRHLVPECFVPRHIPFDDDSGSVRRYRLDLEDERQEEKMVREGELRRRKGWQFWTLRKSHSF